MAVYLIRRVSLSYLNCILYDCLPLETLRPISFKCFLSYTFSPHIFKLLSQFINGNNIKLSLLLKRNKTVLLTILYIVFHQILSYTGKIFSAAILCSVYDTIKTYIGRIVQITRIAISRRSEVNSQFVFFYFFFLGLGNVQFAACNIMMDNCHIKST